VIVERPSLERRVLQSLEASRIPVVLGGCGTGRTSLLLRVERLAGPDRSQYLDMAAAATTPERCLAAILSAARLRGSVPPTNAAAPASPRAAFDGLMAFFDAAPAGGGPATFLLDEALDLRTFESFPGLRHVQREVIARLAASPSRFVLASRFTARAHRLLRDAPARFEVIHLPPLDVSEVTTLARLFGNGRRDWATPFAPAIAALMGGRAAYVHILLEAMASMGSVPDPVAALAALFAPDGRLTARCRESYEFRLHRARGYGALKAILGILADAEPINLTEISHHLRRTPGSTKDYLSWLEDVDLVTAQGKRYTFEDPLLRVYVRLYGRPVPPSDVDVVREVQTFAEGRLARIGERAVEPALATAERTGEAERSGIIEID
jgi:hypothetical protein